MPSSLKPIRYWELAAASYSIEKIRETAKKINKSFEHQHNDGDHDDDDGDGDDGDGDNDDDDHDDGFLICPPIR